MFECIYLKTELQEVCFYIGWLQILFYQIRTDFLL